MRAMGVGGWGDPGPINKNQQLKRKQAKTDYNRMETIWPNLLIGWTKLQQTETDYKLWIGLRNQGRRFESCRAYHFFQSLTDILLSEKGPKTASI